MRAKIAAAALFIATSSVFGQSFQFTRPALSLIPDGTLADNTYTNDELGMVFHFPQGWAGKLDSGHSVVFGKDPNGPANKCTRILLRYESPRKVKGWFSGWGIVFAIDPDCLSIGPFPASPETRNTRVDDLARKIVQLYHPAPFFPPGTLDVSADRLEWPSGPVIICLRGNGSRNVDEIDPTRKRDPVPVSTEFVVTQGSTYWLGWAAIVDHHSRDELSKSSLQIRVP